MITVSNIANASRGELLCITYELLLEQIELAKESEQIQQRKEHTQKAIKIIHMLVGDLDFSIELSHELFRIYVYVQGLLINAKQNDKLEEAYRLIHKIYEGYKRISAEEEGKKPSIANAEAIYAGFTYGKQSVNEFTMGNQNRGFKA
ncbi:MAG: flagellar protein FliS [Cellulosilyticum sp.]|nr:flagellar protein FliS [Cellulosilyticum sp.]